MHKKTLQRTLFGISAAAVVALTTPATARDRYVVARDHYAAADRQAQANAAAAGVGVAAGTAVGLGITEGAITASSVGTTLPATVAGAAAVGGVAGVGAGALVHAATTPCQGFHALFGNFLASSEGCVNGRYVGVEPRRRVVTRVVR